MCSSKVDNPKCAYVVFVKFAASVFSFLCSCGCFVVFYLIWWCSSVLRFFFTLNLHFILIIFIFVCFYFNNILMCVLMKTINSFETEYTNHISLRKRAGWTWGRQEEIAWSTIEPSYLLRSFQLNFFSELKKQHRLI